jgi:hypothetical protein
VRSLGAVPVIQAKAQTFRKERGKGGALYHLSIGGNAWEFIALRADAGSLDFTESLAARAILFRSG